MIKKFRKKIPVIEAVQFIDTTENIDEISIFVDKLGIKEIKVDYSVKNKPVLKIPFNKTKGIRVAKGDYLLKGLDNSISSCPAIIFEKVYEEVK